MRGRSNPQGAVFHYFQPDELIPADHPLRRIKALAGDALRRLEPVFRAMYSERGRPSIPPEQLLKSQLLIALYSVRSDRQFCEQLRYNFQHPGVPASGVYVAGELTLHRVVRLAEPSSKTLAEDQYCLARRRAHATWQRPC